MHICKSCGDIHTNPSALCCGEVVIPLEEALGFQSRLFDLTENEKAQDVLNTLKANYEGAAEKLNKARQKVAEASIQKEAAATTLLNFYKLTTSSVVG